MLATLRHRNFALLWIAGLISVAGDFALIAVLPLHAYALTGSAAAAGGVFAAALLPRIVLGSIAGVYVDRWDRQRTMVAADLLRAALLLPLLAVDAPDLLWLLYLVRAATGVAGLLFGPAESALLPTLVGEERLVTANALNALNNNLGRLIGPAVGGVLYATAGLEVVVLADAASFAASAGLIAMIRANARPDRAGLAERDGPPWRRLGSELRAGLQVVGQQPAIRTVVLSLGIGLLGEGTFEVGFPPLVIDIFAGGAGGAGAILSAQAIGGLIAGAVVARVGESIAPRTLYAAGLFGHGLADLGMVNATTFVAPGSAAVVWASAFMILAGFPVVALNAAAQGILQRQTSDAFRGRVFGALGTVQGISILAGLALGALAVDRVGVVAVLSAGALMWIVAGIFTLLRFPPGQRLLRPAYPTRPRRRGVDSARRCRRSSRSNQ